MDYQIMSEVRKWNTYYTYQENDQR